MEASCPFLLPHSIHLFTRIFFIINGKQCFPEFCELLKQINCTQKGSVGTLICTWLGRSTGYNLGLVTGIWSRGQGLGPELSTCGIWCSLQVGRVSTELDWRMLSWYPPQNWLLADREKFSVLIVALWEQEGNGSFFHHHHVNTNFLIVSLCPRGLTALPNISPATNNMNKPDLAWTWRKINPNYS
jgi:hypothetical protein